MTASPLPNARHEKFCQLLVQGMSQTAAYREAGFKSKDARSARAAAARLVATGNIATRLESLKSAAAAKTVASIALTKTDIIRMIVEQHERNIGIRTVTHKIVQKTGKNAGKVIEKTTTNYDPKAASQTAKMLADEWGVGVGGSAGAANTDSDADARNAEDPKLLRAIEGLKGARKLVLAGGKDVEAPAIVPGRVEKKA